MNRRWMIGALALWPAGRLLAQADAETASRPRLKISAGQLHAALSSRFPVRFGVQELIVLQVGAPRLHLLPARNRLGAGLVAQASGPALQEPQGGEVDLSFKVRYDPSDRTVRAHEPEVLDVRLPGLPPDAAGSLQKLLGVAGRQALGQMVLYQFSEKDLAVADTMGFQPETLEVLDDGLLILFGQKAR